MSHLIHEWTAVEPAPLNFSEKVVSQDFHSSQGSNDLEDQGAATIYEPYAVFAWLSPATQDGRNYSKWAGEAPLSLPLASLRDTIT